LVRSHAGSDRVWHTFAMPAPNPDNEVKATIPNTHQEPASRDDNPKRDESDAAPKEIGGRDGPDPTRYGDWEKAGRCIDF